ncbi:MAG: hypothetical protein AB7O84_08185 [Planctomycetota bacterium]
MQDIFCGPETIVHVRSGAADPTPAAIAAALKRLGVDCEGVERDDAAMF